MGTRPCISGLPMRRSANAVASAPASSLLANHIASWKLSDAQDAGPNALHLTEVNSPTYTTGQVGNAVSLVSASSQHLRRTNESLLTYSTGFTVCWWADPDSVAVRRAILTSGTFMVEHNSAIINITVGGFVNYGSASVMTTGWQHLAVVYDGAGSGNSGRLKLYRNGGAVALSYAGTIPASVSGTWDTIIGYDPYLTARYFDGLIDEASIWNAPLSATQIANLYAAQLAGGGSYPFTGIP